MGQQQLLLVILVTIVVGIAAVVAITTFGQNADSYNVDAVRQDMLAIGTTAQGYLMKHESMGGGGGEFTDMTFYDISFASDSLSSDGLVAYNKNGTYTLSSVSSSSVQLSALPSNEANTELFIEIYESDFEWIDSNQNRDN